jgi:hypothetical protein
MQLAASVLSQFNLPPEEINTHLNNFRKKHLSELQALAALSGEAQRRDFCVCYKTSRDVCSRCTGWLATWVSCIC